LADLDIEAESRVIGKKGSPFPVCLLPESSPVECTVSTVSVAHRLGAVVSHLGAPIETTISIDPASSKICLLLLLGQVRLAFLFVIILFGTRLPPREDW